MAKHDEHKPLTDYREQFEAKWTKAQPALSAYLTSTVRNQHIVDDLLQRVAVTAFAKRDRFSPQQASFLTWVIGIARIEVLRWKSEAASDCLVFSEEVIERLGEAQENTEDSLSDLRAALRVCVNKLRDRFRRLIDLRYASEMTSRQIADAVGSTPGSVRVALTRIRSELHRCVRSHIGLGETEL